MSVNAKQLKKQLTVVDYKMIEDDLGLRRFSDSPSQTIFYNADAHRNPSDQKPKLYGYKDTHTYVSYTRGCSYDIFALIQAVKTTRGEACSFIDALNYVLHLTGYTAATPTTSSYHYDWSNLERFIRIKRGETVLKTYDDAILSQLDTTYYQGWIDEGISVDTMEKYGIRWYDRCSQIVIPCRDERGDLVGVRVRNLDPDANAKYIPLILLDGTTYKFPTNDVFYGINHNKPVIEQKGHVILVEGEKSVLKADTWWGHNSNVLALYGSNLGQTRLRQLITMGVSHVTLALDSDFHEIGDKDYQVFEKKMLNIAKMFRGYARCDIVYNNIGLTDWYKCSPFDGDEDRWNELYENREEIK